MYYTTGVNTTGEYTDITYIYIYLPLHCIILTQSRLDNIMIYQQDVSSTLSSLPNLTTSAEGIKLLKDLLERGESLCVDISQLTELRNVSLVGGEMDRQTNRHTNS